MTRMHNYERRWAASFLPLFPSLYLLLSLLSCVLLHHPPLIPSYEPVGDDEMNSEILCNYFPVYLAIFVCH